MSTYHKWLRTQQGGRRGVALVIILAFVVLLTGLVIAFFSRSLIDRQISNSSVSRAKVSDFADGAAETIIGNLRQEIVLSSAAWPLSSGTLYTPLVEPVMVSGVINSGAAALSMLPQLAGVSTTGTAAPNLLITSATGGQLFYSGKNASGSQVSISENAVAISSTTPSLNGRYLTAARWNEHYLLPIALASSTDSTPVLSTATGGPTFTPPSWVLVSRSGTNPVISNFNGNNAIYLSSGSDAVIGRYAYAIYHEGGLLDVNAAGYPSSTGTFSAYKDGLPYADLSQVFVPLFVAGGQTLASATTNAATCIDQLVAWRNYASVPPPGSVTSPNYTGNTAAAAAYSTYTLSNTTGFLSISGTALNNGTQSDHLFASRQELIRFAQNMWGFNPGNSNNKYLNVLNYLTTFTRDLNQPSYIPVQSVNTNAPGYVAGAPAILNSTAGGNNAAPDLQQPPGTHLDTQINCAFPTVLVPSPGGWQRNDGTTAQPGEPVVKKRFALSRLAWITCKEPSAPRAMSSDPDIVALKAAGYSTAWLQQGTTQNIQSYFGLQWSTAGSGAEPGNFWTYVHGRSGSSGPIMKIYAPSDSNDVTRAGREADFFELLKAAIKAGSIGKVGSSVPLSATSTATVSNLYNQYYADYSIDDQIIQIGANIIDQFKSDNYPVRIQFNDGTNPATMFRGIENLPYLYRVHPAVVKTVAPLITSGTDPTQNTPYYGTADTLSISATNTIRNTGVGAVILIPELWNPHEWCGDESPTQSQLTQTIGTMGPGNFEIYATANTQAAIEAAGFFGYTATTNYGLRNQGASPGLWSQADEPQSITEATTKMTFAITNDANGAQLFREPTVLYIPNAPSGCNLSAPGLWPAPPATNNTLIAAVGDGPPYNTGTSTTPSYPGPPIVNQPYVGMYLGRVPLIWKTSLTSSIYRANTVIFGQNQQTGITFTFNLECQDAFGNLVPYDTKTVTIGHYGEGWGRIARPMHMPWAGLLQPCRDGDRVYFVLDPRTSRFGFQQTGIDSAAAAGDNPDTATDSPRQLQWSFPPFSYYHLQGNLSAGTVPTEASWLSRSQGIMGSFRNGWGNGAPMEILTSGQLDPINYPSSMGFYPGNTGADNQTTNWSWKNPFFASRPGLLAENDAGELYNDQIAGDVQYYAGRTVGINYNQPQFYVDADGVERRGMGGWTDARTQFIGPNTEAAFTNNYTYVTGLPMRVANKVFTDNKLHKTDILLNYPVSAPPSAAPVLQSDGRPMILHRPFRSVAELDYTFSGTPWRNLDFDKPESGTAALLDVFCINDTVDPAGLVAGRTNLNTRQAPVLTAIISGAYKDELQMDGTATSAAVTSGTLSFIQANRLVARTTGTGVVPAGVIVSGTGVRPLQNLGALVGRYVSAQAVPTVASPAAPPNTQCFTSYDGYSADLLNPLYFLNYNLTPYTTPNTDATDDPNFPYAIVQDKAISRRRGAPIRGLANAGQTRVWNLLIDIVAQTGRYPQAAASASNPLSSFLVEGERHYWVHVAIDRLTGQVINKQVEVVKE